MLAADRVVQPKAQSSGIARYGWELLSGLERLDDWDLFVLVQEPAVGWHRAAAAGMFDRLRNVLGDRLLTVAKSQSQDTFVERFGELRPGDVVHSIHLPLPPIRLTGPAARVLTVHDVLHVSQPHLNAGPGTPTIEHVLKSIDGNHDFVMCDSDQTRRDLLAVHPIPGDRVETVRLGTTPVASRPPGGDLVPSSWTGYIVTMLQVEPRKNCAALLEAVRDVFGSGRHPGVGLVAVGTVPAIRQHRGALDLIDHARVVTHGDLPDNDVRRLLSAATCFVYPSLYEGFGLPPLEAMACGCPAIVVAGSSLIEVVGDAAMYAHGGTAGDLATAIELILSTPSLRAELSRRGVDRAAGLSWQHTVRETIGFYERAIARTTSSWLVGAGR